MNGRFPIALHIMTLLCQANQLISSDYIAGSINVNPVLIRKELSNLIKHQLVKARKVKGGYMLSKSAKEISLAGIYKAVKPETILGVAKNQPNPACSIGRQINQHINTIYDDVDRLVLNQLGNLNLLDFCNKFN